MGSRPAARYRCGRLSGGFFGRTLYRTRALDTCIGRAMSEPQEVTGAKALRDAGYATGILGNWHLGDSYPMQAMDRGFEEPLMHRGGGIGQPSDQPGGEVRSATLRSAG